MPVNVDSNLTVPNATQTVQHNNTSTEHLNIPLHVNYTHSETIINPSPINIEPHSDLNVIEEECASTDIQNEIIAGVKSRNQKLFNCKVRLKKWLLKLTN